MLFTLQQSTTLDPAAANKVRLAQKPMALRFFVDLTNDMH